MLSPYTTNDEVRAALGVSEEELLNATLDLPLYEANLLLELEEVGLTLTADFATARSETTDAAKRFVRATGLFSTYAVAVQFKSSLPLLAVKSITDGKAGVTRHSDSPFEEIIKEVKQLYEKYRQALAKAWAAYKSAAAPTAPTLPTMFVVVAPADDPVLGTT